MTHLIPGRILERRGQGYAVAAPRGRLQAQGPQVGPGRRPNAGDQLRDAIARHHRLLMTIGWVVLVAGSWLDGCDGGALGLALLLVTLWGLEREQRRSPDTPTHLRPGYLRGFSWLCIAGCSLMAW